MTSFIHPSLLFYTAALLVPFVKGKARSALLIGMPLLSFLLLYLVAEGNYCVLDRKSTRLNSSH